MARARVSVPLGDARARRARGERPGRWRTITRVVRALRGRPGARVGEIVWRGFPYPVREARRGAWRVELYGPPNIGRRARRGA